MADTSSNEVTGTISSPGVYAAFTTAAEADVEDDEYGAMLPYWFDLAQNYLNPFNPVTTINYSLPERSEVSIETFNVLGRKVQVLVNREQLAGNYTIKWNGTNVFGKSVATGVYFYRFQAGDHQETKKMLFLK